METQVLGSDEFDLLVKEHKLLFIDFWAQWCAPCKPFSMVYEQVAEQYPQIKFLKVNIEKQKELVDFLGIRSIPYLMAIKDEIVIYSNAGSIGEKTLIQLANQLLQVDVSAIKQLIQGDV
ncbi:MAG: thioredoxin family protein [Legionella sp.]|nr:thioredoxin family protein [Legionella sp.]